MYSCKVINITYNVKGGGGEGGGTEEEGLGDPLSPVV